MNWHGNNIYYPYNDIYYQHDNVYYPYGDIYYSIDDISKSNVKLMMTPMLLSKLIDIIENKSQQNIELQKQILVMSSHFNKLKIFASKETINTYIDVKPIYNSYNKYIDGMLNILQLYNIHDNKYLDGTIDVIKNLKIQYGKNTVIYYVKDAFESLIVKMEQSINIITKILLRLSKSSVDTINKSCYE